MSKYNFNTDNFCLSKQYTVGDYNFETTNQDYDSIEEITKNFNWAKENKFSDGDLGDENDIYFIKDKKENQDNEPELLDQNEAFLDKKREREEEEIKQSSLEKKIEKSYNLKINSLDINRNDYFTSLNNNESNYKDSRGKNVNLLNKDNINTNQDKIPEIITPDKVCPCREFLKKKRKSQKTNDLDKNKNETNSENNIMKIKNKIMKEINNNNNKKNKFIILKKRENRGLTRTDIKYEENWRYFLGLIKTSLNDIIKELNKTQNLNIDFLKNTNFQIQYREQKKNFINISLYEFLIYDPPKIPKYKKNRNNGSFNKNIIDAMNKTTIYETNQIKLFNELIKLDIKSIHKIFMEKENIIKINGAKNNLPKFKIFNDYSDELKEILVNEN